MSLRDKMLDALAELDALQGDAKTRRKRTVAEAYAVAANTVRRGLSVPEVDYDEPAEPEPKGDVSVDGSTVTGDE